MKARSEITDLASNAGLNINLDGNLNTKEGKLVANFPSGPDNEELSWLVVEERKDNGVRPLTYEA